MKRFAELLDRLAYEGGRNNKLRLMTDYFRSVPDPERGWALAALTGALTFRHAKPGVIRGLIAARTDPVLFALSYDYVGDLSETVALMWPAPPQAADARRPSLSAVVAALASLGKSELPAQLARWLDQLDETGRWALLKLVTGGSAHRGVGAARQDRRRRARRQGRAGARADLARPATALPGTVRLARRPRRAAVEPRSRSLPAADAGARDRGERSRRARAEGFPGRMEMGRHPRAGRRRRAAPTERWSRGSIPAPARTSRQAFRT